MSFIYRSTLGECIGTILHPIRPWPDHFLGFKLRVSVLPRRITTILTLWFSLCLTREARPCMSAKFEAFKVPNSAIMSPALRPASADGDPDVTSSIRAKTGGKTSGRVTSIGAEFGSVVSLICLWMLSNPVAILAISAL